MLPLSNVICRKSDVICATAREEKENTKKWQITDEEE